MHPPSITELPNELTNDLDIVGPEGIVRLLRQADAQIFNGWRAYPGLYDGPTLQVLDQLTGVLAKALQTPERTAIVMSGAGTSGRLAFFIARRFNEQMRRINAPECFHYLMAGGDKALIRAQEGAEDDPVAAVRDLSRFEQPGRTIIYIGITCGCSAPYIAAQLDYAMNRPGYVTVLLGFNPLERARRTPIEKWNKTFYDVMAALAELSGTLRDDGAGRRHFILNPVIGPEPLTGSTRMKSGTATKLLLEAMFHVALDEAANLPFAGPGEDDAEDDTLISDVNSGDAGDTFKMRRYELIKFFQACEAAHRSAYAGVRVLGGLIECAGRTLRRGGHIYYVGRDAMGILGLIDASECPPTFGADFADVRGFVAGGWQTLENKEGDLSGEGRLYQVSVADFQNQIVQSVTEDDLIVFLQYMGNSITAEPLPLDLAQMARERNATLACISISVEGEINDDFDMEIYNHDDLDENDFWSEDEDDGGGFMDGDEDFDEMDFEEDECDDDDMEDADLDYELAFDDDPVIKLCEHHIYTYVQHTGVDSFGPDYFAELACKWTLNAITTGAHVLKGKVFQNRMIDLRISNNKLYYRSIGIIGQLMGVNEDTARECLLRAIYETDYLSEAQRGAPISAHIETGASVTQIVPVALLLATGQFTVASAREALSADPVVRNIVLKYAAK